MMFEQSEDAITTLTNLKRSLHVASIEGNFNLNLSQSELNKSRWFVS